MVDNKKRTVDEIAVATAETPSVEEIARIMTSTGAVVRVKRMPSHLLQAISTQYPEPKPPMVTTERGGKKFTEPNYDDPTYAQEVNDHGIRVGDVMLNLVLLRGMDMETLPAGVVPFDEDKDWAEEMRAVGFTIPENRTGRYLLWLRDKIAPALSDLEEIRKASQHLEGISEEDIQAAVERFRH